MTSEASIPPGVKNIEELIIETVVHLRRRKARPDLDRICRLMSRRHLVESEDTQNALVRMVQDNHLHKVNFKGSCSYRVARLAGSLPVAPVEETVAVAAVVVAVKTEAGAAATIPKKKKLISHLNKRVQNSASESRRLLEAVRSVRPVNSSGSSVIATLAKSRRRPSSAIRTTRADNKKMLTEVVRSSGARLSDIERHLAKHKVSGPNNKKLDDRQRLLAALQCEVRAGTIQQLDNGCYVTSVKKEVKEEEVEEMENDDEDEVAEDSSEISADNSPKNAARPLPISTSSSKSTKSIKSVTASIKASSLARQKKNAARVFTARGRPFWKKSALLFRRPLSSVAPKRETPSVSGESSEAATSTDHSSPGSTPAAKRRKIIQDDVPESPPSAVPAKTRLVYDRVDPTCPASTVVVASTSALVGLERRFRRNRIQRVFKTDEFRAPAPVPIRVSNRLNKRKRFKKTHGPDFVENYDSSFEEPISKCDSCSLPETCNLTGDREDFLVCVDCNVKVHPTCMSYSLDMALRCRRSPWQCFDCRPCCICQESDDPDTMLFCDLCDKGYHMVCHNPEVMDKPSDRWRCRHCRTETDRRDRVGGAICSNVPAESEAEEEHNQPSDSDSSDSAPPTLTRQTPLSPTPVAVDDEAKADDAKASTIEGESSKCTVDGETGLPTPCDSPVPDVQPNKRPLLMYFGHPNKFDENKENMLASDVPDATEWSVDEVEKYIHSIGFTEQAKFFVEQEIDGKSLLLMKRNDVLTGLSLKLGPALKIYKYVRRLQVKHADDCRS